MDKKHTHIRLVEDRAVKVLEIGVPPGATLGRSIKIVARLDDIIKDLTGCPCLSGIDVRFKNHLDEIAEFG